MEDKKTVWCISKYASPPDYAGGARLFYVAKEFSELGFDVLLISSDSNHLAKYPKSDKTYNFESYGHLSHMWIKTYKYVKSASIKRFISWFDFELKLFNFRSTNFKKPDAVIISSLSLLSVFYGVYLKRKYKSKLVFEIRDIHPLILMEEFGVNKWNPMVLLLGIIERYGYKNADLIVGTMPNLKQHVKEVMGMEKEVFHSPVGIPAVWYNEQIKSVLVDELFPVQKKFVVGYAGSMGISNALDTLIEIIEKMSLNEDVHFVLVGDGDLKEYYIKRLASLNNVTIGPKINRNEIPYFLSKCDLLYLSMHKSRVLEYGQSLNKLNDYMMSGKPVVASYSGYESMLNEANSGVFVPSGDVDAGINAINTFKDMDENERMQYGARGNAWVSENHNYKTIALKYYNKICDLFK